MRLEFKNKPQCLVDGFLSLIIVFFVSFIVLICHSFHLAAAGMPVMQLIIHIIDRSSYLFPLPRDGSRLISSNRHLEQLTGPLSSRQNALPKNTRLGCFANVTSLVVTSDRLYRG